MSLVGNLEDLGLGDILQIVSLSRKSGVLVISSDGKDGRIVFRNGQVIRAFSTDVEEDVEKAIADTGVVSQEQLGEALDVYREEGGRLDAILAERFNVSQEGLDEIKKRHIEESAYSLFGWKSGSFNFELKDVEEYIEGKDGRIDFLVYEHGISPQFLAMEGTRLQDELRREREERGEIAEEMPAKPEAAPPVEEKEADTGVHKLFEEPAFEREGVPKAPAGEAYYAGIREGVVVIDDDRNVLDAIYKGLKKSGYNIFAEEKAENALHIISEMKAAGAAVAVLSDLIMPRMDGTGILGGIELLELLRDGFPDVSVILMTDHENKDAEARAEKMGAYSYISKPKRSEFAAGSKKGGVAVFISKLDDLLRPVFEEGGAPAEAAPSAMVDLAADLKEEFEAVGKILPEEVPKVSVPLSPGMSILRSMLQELNSPGGGRQAILLTLRFASELMNRSVVFMVRKDTFEGLGESGIEIEGEIAEKRVRSMKLSKDVPSILRDVLNSGGIVKKEMEDTDGNRYILEMLGGFYPVESFAAPIVANGRVAVILYGDNAPGEKEIGDTSALEIFLMEAGFAMDRALLERKMREMSEK